MSYRPKHCPPFCPCASDYRILSIKGKRLNRAKRCISIPADFDLYRRHHAGASNRYKVRSRQYVETGKEFSEIKHKDNKRQTHKQRFATNEFCASSTPRAATFAPALSAQRRSAVWPVADQLHAYHAGQPDDAERVTIDLDLSFEWEGRIVALPHHRYRG